MGTVHLHNRTNIPMSLIVLFICCVFLVSGITKTHGACIEKERRALLQFKDGFVDDFGVFSSWRSTSLDCCLWKGVGCSRSDHVIRLNLHGYWSDDLKMRVNFSGEINSSLLELDHLHHLDLSFNRFNRIPEFIGSFRKLYYLNLSGIDLEVSRVPPQLGNLSYLQTLDLSYSSIIIQDTEWLSKLSSLKYLSLSYVDLSASNNLLKNVITSLPYLFELHLVNCHLPQIPVNTFLPFTNFSKSLSVLDISDNALPSSLIYPWLFNFSGTVTSLNISQNLLLGTFPEALCEFKSIQNMDLTNTGIGGGMPKAFGNFSNLRLLHLGGNNLKEDLPRFFHLLEPAQNSIQVLDISSNKISGSLPDFTTFTELRELRINENDMKGSFPENFKKISNLIILDLGDNQMSGLLPDLSALSSLRELYMECNRLEGILGERIMPLSELQSLGASANLFHGKITEAHLANLSHLVYLDLSYNSFALEIDIDWSPTFSLNVIALSSCKLGPSFPTWLQTQKNISILDISIANISERVPDWFWKQLTPTLRYLNLSHNQIPGTVPNLMYGDRPYIDYSSNNLSGPLPLFPSNTQNLVLNNNMFSGSIASLWNLENTFNIDLSNNHLSGELPDFWMNFTQLLYLNIKNNNFDGRIPASMGYLPIIMLSMSSNSLTGELPSSLTNWSSLQFLDLGGNKLSGHIPSWLGINMSELHFLSLANNSFDGTMPTSFCMLSNLQILDISSNNISGSIPSCLSTLKAMTQIKTIAFIGTYCGGLEGVPRSYIGRVRHVFKALLEWKGMKHEYSSTLGLVTSLDLSNNMFSGEIPSGITNLLGLVALNLSRNNLASKIPQDIGRLIRLDFLDVSRNHLVGGIPTSLSQLTNLGVLDLSNNNLSGRIPTSTQLQSFNVLSYMGNAALCGIPLPNTCPGDSSPQSLVTRVKSDDAEDQDKLITPGFFISLAIGSAFGFWGVSGILVVSNSWRDAYYGYLGHFNDWIYVTVVVSYAKLMRRLGTKC